MARRKIKKRYTYAVIAVDGAVFTIIDGALHVLLMKMKKNPYTRAWALPGGLIRGDELPEDAAKRHVFEKTGIKNIDFEELHTFGKINRDPFGRVYESGARARA